MTLIEVEELRHLYRTGSAELWALDGIDLVIQRGEFAAVMGPSGSGKSTLMHIVGCLDRPTEGTYRLEGKDIGRQHHDALASIRNRSIGFVFQAYNLLPRATALENVELPLVYARVHRHQRRQRALAMLDRLGLSSRACHFPRELSGGEQQRVAIARALVNEPAVLLADEPTGALDSQTGHEILTILRSLNEEGMTIVLVTHEAEVAAHAKRLITLRDGRIVSDHPRLEIVAPEPAGHAVRQVRHAN